MSEAEVGADGDPLSSQRLAEDLIDEGFGAELCQLKVEGHQHKLLDAQRLQQLEFFTGKIETQARFSEQHFPRMGPEADHGRHSAVSIDGPCDHLPVPGMEAVEAAERQGRGPSCVLGGTEGDQREMRMDAFDAKFER